MMRGRSWVPPMPGKMPRVTSGTANTALSLATIRSERTASSQPPPMREALDGRDDGHRTVEHARRGLLEDQMLGAPGLVRHALALLQVAAHAEGLVARAGEDHGAGRRCPT